MSAMGRSADLQRRQVTGGQRPAAEVAATESSAAKRTSNRNLRCITGGHHIPLQLKDLAKLNQIIGRIQAGNFDANDVDNLLMRPASTAAIQ
jgi:hypothetical protein